MVDFSPNSTSEAFNRGLASTGVGGRSIFSSDNQDGQSGPSPEIIQSFKDAAVKYDVPVDVLMGMAEKDSGFNQFNRTRGPGPKVRGIINVGDEEVSRGDGNPYEPSQNIDTAARKLRGYLDAGMSVQDAVKAHAGGSDPSKWTPEVDAYGQDVLSRTQRLVDSYLPELKPRVVETETKINPATGKPEPLTAEEAGRAFGIEPPARSVVSDMGAQLEGGMVKGAGSIMEGAAQSSDAIRHYAGLPEYRSMANAIADKWMTQGKSIERGVSEETKQAIADSSPSGDISKPSTWTLGKNPSLTGYFALGMDVFGGMLPVAAAGIGGGVVGGAVVGGLQGGGNAAQSARELINKMAVTPADPKNPDGPKEIETQSSYYKLLIDQGKTPEQALNLTKSAAERTAFIFTAPISALGGAATSKILSPASKLVGGSAGREIGGKAALGALEEGTQEVGEQVAQNVGTNTGAGTSIDPMDETFGNFILGAIGGGGTGGSVGALTAGAEKVQDKLIERRSNRAAGDVLASGETAPRDASAIPESAAPAVEPQTRGDVSPAAMTEAARDLAAGAPGRQTVSEVEQPAPAPATARPGGKGPLSRVLETGAPDVAPLASTAGERVTMSDEMGSLTGAVISQDAEGVLFKSDDGLEQLISNQDIVDGKVRIAKGGEAPVSQVPVDGAETNFGTMPAPAPVAEPVASQEAPAPADSDIAEQAMATITEPPVTFKRTYEDMSEPELRDRMKYIAGQAKAAGGWNKMLIDERKKVEKAINALKAPAPALPENEKPASAEKPAEAAPTIDDNKLRWILNNTWGARQDAQAAVENNGLAATHEVQDNGKGRFTVVPKAEANPDRSEASYNPKNKVVRVGDWKFDLSVGDAIAVTRPDGETVNYYDRDQRKHYGRRGEGYLDEMTQNGIPEPAQEIVRSYLKDKLTPEQFTERLNAPIKRDAPNVATSPSDAMTKSAGEVSQKAEAPTATEATVKENLTAQPAGNSGQLQATAIVGRQAAGKNSKNNRLSAADMLSDVSGALSGGSIDVMRFATAPKTEQIDALIEAGQKREDADIDRIFGSDAERVKGLIRRGRIDAVDDIVFEKFGSDSPEANEVNGIIYGMDGYSILNTESLKALRDRLSNLEFSVEDAANGDTSQLSKELAWVAPELPDISAPESSHTETQRIAILSLARAVEDMQNRGVDAGPILKNTVAYTINRLGGGENKTEDAGLLLERLSQYAKQFMNVEEASPVPASAVEIAAPAAESVKTPATRPRRDAARRAGKKAKSQQEKENTNAAQEGLKPENNQQQYQDGNGGRKATEASRSDSNVSGEQIQEAGKEEVTAQTTEAEHQDVGEAAEDATQTVVNETVAKAAVAEKVSPSQMRDWLVKEIDKAISKAPKPDPTISTTKPHTSRGRVEFYAGKGTVGDNDRIQVTVREGSRDWGVYASNGGGKYGGKSELIYSFEASGPAAARKAAEVLLDRAYLDEDGNTKIAEAKTITFDVPGDGKFNVVNTAQALTAFRDRVMKSPGFKNSRSSGNTATLKVSSAATEPASQEQAAEFLSLGRQIEEIAKRHKAAPNGEKAELQSKISGLRERAENIKNEMTFAAASGHKIYPLFVRKDDGIALNWGVQTQENKERDSRGERQIGGDSIVKTREDAINEAKRIAEDADRNAERAEKLSKERMADEKAESERIADTYNGFLEGMAANRKELARGALSKKYNFKDDGEMSVRERIEKLFSDGKLQPETSEIDKIKPMTRAQFNRASNEEQRAHAKRIADGGKKTEYYINGSLLGKTAYDYAQHLLSKGKAESIEGKNGPDTALYSVGKEAPAAQLSVSELRETLTGGPEGAAIAAMIESGAVVIHQTEQEIPGYEPQAGPVQGAVTPDGVIHIVAGNVDAPTARGVLLHEAFHEGGEALVGSKAWNTLLSRVDTAMRSDKPFWREAVARANAAKTSPEHMAEEVAAYAIENRENAPAGVREWVDNFLGQFKAWALRRFGKQFGSVTPGQLRALAAAALRARRDESNPATTGGSERFSIEGAQSGEEGGYLGDVQRAAIDNILAGKKRGAPVVFQKVPRVLEALGVKQTPVAVPQPVIWKAVDKHGMTPDMIKAALDGIANPVMVFDSDTTPGSFVILVDVPGESRPVVVAAHKDENIGRIEITRIASIHRKDSGQSVIRWWNEGLTRYFNKTKAGEWVRSRGLYLPKDGSPKHRLGIKILQHSDVFNGGSGPRYSIGRTAVASGKNKSVVQRANDAASDFLTQAMVGGGWKPGQFSSLALTPVRALFTELAEGLPSAQTYLDTKQSMDAFRNEMNTADDALLQDWLKWGRKNKAANSSLMDVMHDSTLVQYDPTLTDAEAKSKGQTVDRGVKDAYAALPTKAKEFYAKIRDAYAQRSKDVEDQVVANVQKALTMILRNAQRAYDAEIKRIKDDGLTGKAKADAEKAAQNKLKMAQTRLARNKAARIKRMRQYFESNRLKGPYFPLARFGNYFVTLRDTDGKVLSFEKFSSRFAQRARAEELRAVYGVDAVQESTAQYEDKNDRAVDPGFLASVDTILDEAGVDMGVRDAIYQTYLETMPDLSMRKAQIHRKGTAGFDSDAVRGFAHNMFHSAHQLSRLRFGMDLQDHLAEAAKQSRQGADTVRKQAVYSEMAKSHQFTMNPEGSPLAHHVTSAVFLWTMAFNLSTAMVNTLQSVNVGIPNIAFDVDTAGKPREHTVARLMARSAVDFVRGKGTVLDSSKLTDDEQAAVRAAYDSGLIDSTQAHDLAGVAESGIDYRPGWQRFMRAASMPMHQTERFNREVTFLAAYRVAREAGIDHAAAIKKAENQTWATHFDNQSNAKPRFARGQAGKMLFALKSYQANFVYRIFRDLHQSLQGKTQVEREVALKRFASMFILTSAAAGIRGAFFYSTVMAIAGAFMGLAGKDDDDPDEILRKAIIEHIPDAIIGHAVSGMLLDGIPGYFTGTSLTNRVGMQDMWFRTNDRDMNADQQWTEWTTQLLGAGAGLAHQAYLGSQDIAKGNYQRGIEKMLPASIRNVFKAIRYANDGVQDKYGNPIVENVPWQDVFKQSLGFTPAEIADRFARNTYQNNLQDRIEGKARDARKAVARAMMDKDAKAEAKAREDVTKFNERYPEYLIQPKSIMQSMRNMERRSDRMEYGVDLNPKLSERIKKGTAPSLYAR